MLPKRTLLLIGGLSIVTIALIYVAVISSKPSTPFTQDQTRQVIPTVKPILKTAELYFDPEIVTASSSSSVDVMLNAGNHKVTVVQLELSFDPQAISNISISQPTTFSFFGEKLDYQELFKEVDYKNGIINYAVSISLTSEAKTGIGKVATITYSLTNSTGSPTQIKFLGKTLVTEEGSRESVLKSNRPLTITSAR